MTGNAGKTVAEALREATHPVHKSLELLPVAAALADGSISDAAYRTYLRRLLAVIREVDAGMSDPRLAMPGTGEWMDGCRARWICEDLAALGADVPPAAPPTHGVAAGAALWGGLYVIEGSTLGGVTLARKLAGRHDLKGALRYLNGYGAATGERWRRFRAALTAHVSPEEVPLAAAAAHDMFARFGRDVMA